MALSFANSTRLMKISSYELNDISDQSGFDLEVSSILIASLMIPSSSTSPLGNVGVSAGVDEDDSESSSGYLIQIHRKAIIVSKPNINPGSHLPISQIIKFRWIPPDNSVIEVADVYDSIVLISLSTMNGSLLYFLRLLVDPYVYVSSPLYTQYSFACELTGADEI